MTIASKIFEVLSDGPAMTADIVLELKLTPSSAGAKLDYLYRSGRLTRRKYYIDNDDSRRHSTVERWIYSLPEHARWAA